MTQTRMIRLSEVMQRTGLSKAAVYRMMQADLFPRGVHLIPRGRATGWVEDEIEAWINRRIQARDAITRQGER